MYKKALIFMLCAAMTAAAPLTAAAAQAGENAGPDTAAAQAGESAGQAKAEKSAAELEEAREKAEDVIDEAGGQNFGSQILDASGEALTQEQTVMALRQLRTAVNESSMLGEYAEQNKGVVYHYTGAGRRSGEIEDSLQSLYAYMKENGTRAAQEDADSSAESSEESSAESSEGNSPENSAESTDENTVYELRDQAKNGAEWVITYVPQDEELRFVYMINGRNSSLLARMSYNTVTYKTSPVGLAAWGAISGSGKYAASWEAPCHRVFTTRPEQLTFETVYSNLVPGNEEVITQLLQTFACDALNCWDNVLADRQGSGFGALGFGAFDCRGWVTTPDGDRMYLGEDSVPYTGEQEIDGEKYIFDADGLLEKE